MFPNNLCMSKIYSNFAGKIPSAEFTDIELALRRISIQTKTPNFPTTIRYTAQLLVLPQRESRVAVVSLEVMGVTCLETSVFRGSRFILKQFKCEIYHDFLYL